VALPYSGASLGEQIMRQVTSGFARSAALPPRRGIPVDFIAAVVFVLLFAIGVHAFQYRGAFAESDIYRVLVGLLDGEVSGTGIASNLHYDNTFGFGYLAAFYAFVGPVTLRDPDKLTNLINQVGFCFMLFGLLCFWRAVSILHGARAGTVALVIFGLGPTVLELGTSGHPAIPMFAWLCAGATLLFLPVTGWRAALAAFGGGVFLLAGLTTRPDIVFAFPWLVLARADTRSLRCFVASCILRSIAPMAAIMVFLILQRLLVPNQMGPVVGEYFGQWFSLSHVVVGLVDMALGCGIATAAAGALAMLWLAWRARPGDGGLGQAGLAQILGPTSLVLLPLVFFVASSGPTRHFILTYAGLSIFLAVALTANLAMRRVAALGVALLLAAASQALAEAVRLPVLAMNDASSPYRPIWTGYLTATHVPLGVVWKRHDALAERRALWQAEGDMLAMPCQTHTVILTIAETAQLFSRLYAGGVPVEAHREGSDDILGRVAGQRSKVMLYLAKPTRWPEDAVAILADPAYKDYKLYQDPYSLSKYDVTPIPPDRQAKFGCPEPTS
jgi:hypothetical protein